MVDINILLEGKDTFMTYQDVSKLKFSKNWIYLTINQYKVAIRIDKVVIIEVVEKVEINGTIVSN